MGRPRTDRRKAAVDEALTPLEGEVGPLGESSESLPLAPGPRERTADEFVRISEHVLHVAKRVKVLSSIAWAPEVRAAFFAAGERELPKVELPDRRAEFRQAEALAREAARCYDGADPIEAMIRATLESHATAARMLAAIGTPEFTTASEELYGSARTVLRDGQHTILDLARHLLEAVDALGVADVDPEETLDDRRAARALKQRLIDAFPGERIKVVLTPGLAAKAVAGSERIRLRQGARYTLDELELLLVHEGWVHIGTTLNGSRQPLLRCLGRASPRTIHLQEGLAVFAEFMAGVVDLRRVRRLADRVVAIDMATRGADFLEVYRYFLERGRDREEAFESARRVFRGGVLTGGAPFTKDVVYLSGAAQVRNFFEVALANGDLDDVARLFVGKVDLEDLPALRALAAGGWISRPRHLPPWARNTGTLAASLSFGAFFRGVDLAPIVEHYADLYDGGPNAP